MGQFLHPQGKFTPALPALEKISFQFGLDRSI
jgi:hypothetical protein